jgi:hypothetical protein
MKPADSKTCWTGSTVVIFSNRDLEPTHRIFPQFYPQTSSATYILKEKPRAISGLFFGGEGGIRTHGGLHLTAFRVRRTSPLCDLSET